MILQRNISSLNLMVSSGVFVCLAALAAADVESPAPVQVAVGAQVAMMKPGFVSFNIDFDNRPKPTAGVLFPPHTTFGKTRHTTSSTRPTVS